MTPETKRKRLSMERDYRPESYKRNLSKLFLKRRFTVERQIVDRITKKNKNLDKVAVSRNITYKEEGTEILVYYSKNDQNYNIGRLNLSISDSGEQIFEISLTKRLDFIVTMPVI